MPVLPLWPHYLFDADFCNVACGWEKGIVEKNVQDSRRRMWQEAGQATLRLLCRVECLAAGTLSTVVAGAAPPGAQRPERRGDAGTGTTHPDAGADAV